MSSDELAWVAGLLEGEGCFSLGPWVNRVKSDKIRQIRVTCEMTDLDTIQRLHEYSGIGSIRREARIDKRYDNAKPLWGWSASKRREIVPFLESILPYMSSRRTSKINELLEYAREHPMIYGTTVHGTYNGYRSGCKCTDCMQAMRDKARYYRERGKKSA